MRDARGLYAIVDPSACRGRDPEQVAAAILRGGCAILQLRDKTNCDRDRLALARRIAVLCRSRWVSFVMNDRPDLALLAGADGLHLGQDDLPIAEARRIAPSLMIGRSTHDLAQAHAAVDEGADLIGVGPIYETQSKKDPDPIVGVEMLGVIARSVHVPIVAIGGLTLDRAPEIREAGALMGAAISAICGAEDPEASARAMHRALRGER